MALQLRRRFGAYEFDSESCELKRNGIRLKITGQPLEVLALLTEHPGVLVTREELRNASGQPTHLLISNTG